MATCRCACGHSHACTRIRTFLHTGDSNAYGRTLARLINGARALSYTLVHADRHVPMGAHVYMPVLMRTRALSRKYIFSRTYTHTNSRSRIYQCRRALVLVRMDRCPCVHMHRLVHGHLHRIVRQNTGRIRPSRCAVRALAVRAHL